MFRVLLICTANVCRSPMAEGILRKRILDQDLDGSIHADSAGVWATDDQQASQLSIQVAGENKIDISNHRSKSLTPQMIKNADLVLCMTPSHKRDILQMHSSADGKVFTLREYLRNGQPVKNSIDDPIGMSMSFYRRIFNEIEQEIDRIFPTIKEYANR